MCFSIFKALSKVPLLIACCGVCKSAELIPSLTHFHIWKAISWSATKAVIQGNWIQQLLLLLFWGLSKKKIFLKRREINFSPVGSLPKWLHLLALGPDTASFHMSGGESSTWAIIYYSSGMPAGSWVASGKPGLKGTLGYGAGDPSGCLTCTPTLRFIFQHETWLLIFSHFSCGVLWTTGWLFDALSWFSHIKYFFNPWCQNIKM